MVNGKVLFLYSNCLNEAGPTGRDDKACDCVEFIKKMLPEASCVRIDFRDPRADAPAEGDVMSIAQDFFDECEVCILVLSNKTTPFLEFLKQNALWDKLYNSKKLIVVSVENTLERRMKGLLRVASFIHLIGYDANSPIREEDDDWNRFVISIKRIFNENLQGARHTEEGQRLLSSAPREIQMSVDANDERRPDGHPAQNVKEQGSVIPRDRDIEEGPRLPPDFPSSVEAEDEQESDVPPNPPDVHPAQNAEEEQEPEVPPNPPDGHPAQNAEKQEPEVPPNPPDSHPAQNAEKQGPEVPPNPPDSHPPQNAEEEQESDVPLKPFDDHPAQNAKKKSTTNNNNNNFLWGIIVGAVGTAAAGAFFVLKNK